MHIGGLRTALFAWLWARKHNGTFILRIEDTDKEREVPGSIEHIMESLRWLELDWDYGPDTPGPFGSCIQSERLKTYHAAAQILIEKGLAYPDPYSAEEIDAFRRAAKADKRPFLFRDHRPTHPGKWDGTRPLRFKIPEIKRTKWHDAVRGDLEAGEEALDDFILIKSDGYPTYNFAHIVDDHHMGVTHIMRADEFISSTPKFLSLYEALDYQPPVFVTLPPILREDKTKKLGKRDGAKDVLTYRDEGYLPDAMVNFLAFIGWNPGGEKEIFTREELIEAFDITGIQTHGAILNEEKLRWFNREYLRDLTLTPPEVFYQYVTAPLKRGLEARGIPYDDAATLVIHNMMPLLRNSVELSSALEKEVTAGEYDYFFLDPAPEPHDLLNRDESPATALKHLSHIRDIFVKDFDYAPWTYVGIKDALWPYASEHGRGDVLWPLRYALTGRQKSPDPFAVAEIIGRTAAIRRLENAIRVLSTL